jgi:hypothetical protein
VWRNSHAQWAFRFSTLTPKIMGHGPDRAVARNFIVLRGINESRHNLTYQPKENHMTFGEAIEALKVGDRVSRSGWNGKEMWLRLQKPDESSDMTLPYIFMSTVTGDLVPWLASQTDMLAEDWFVPEFATGHTDDAGAF